MAVLGIDAAVQIWSSQGYNYRGTARYPSQKISIIELNPLTESDPGDWRHGLLRRVGHVYVGIFLASLVFALLIGKAIAVTWFGVILMLGRAVAYGMARLSLSYRIPAWTMALSMVVASAQFYIYGGPNPGPVLACAFSLVLTALLLGRTALLGVMAAMAFLFLAITGAMWTGLWTGPNPPVNALPTPNFWLRTTVVSVFFWCGITFSVLYVVGALERSTESLRRKEEQRRQSEAARLEAQHRAGQSQKMEALGQLAAGVAHDFNNTLLVIRGWNELVRNSESEDLRSKANQAISQAIDQSEYLARQLLTFSHKQVRKPRHLQLNLVIENTAETLGRLLPSNIRLDIEHGTSSWIFVDEGELQQVLYNLLINARDAITDGGEIRIQTRDSDGSDMSVASPGKWVAIEVKDNGVGMDQSTSDRVFEPFFTTKGVGKGTGLGLATVFGIVQQCNGHIEVATRPHDGSRFTIWLPRVEAVPQTLQKLPLASAAAETTGGNVLVLEDDPLARDLLTFALSRARFAVTVASDGDEAIGLLNNNSEPYDLLCTDAVFPGAGLSEVITRYRETNADGKILICSGYIAESIIIPAVESDVLAYLPKPFTADQLIQEISDLLRQ